MPFALFSDVPAITARCYIAPGAMHHARWMNKVLYREENGLQDITMLHCATSLQGLWITAPSTTRYPPHDSPIFNLQSCPLVIPTTLYSATSYTCVINGRHFSKFAIIVWTLRWLLQQMFYVRF